jgi:hypothetical protein
MSNTAEIVREYGPFDTANIGGVTFDGQRVWAAAGKNVLAFDPGSGEVVRTLECAAHAGTAFDGTHLYQIAEARIDKIDPATGAVVASIPRRAKAATRAWPGPKAAFGWGSIAIAGSTRSIRRPARSCARSNPIVSSPA